MPLTILEYEQPIHSRFGALVEPLCSQSYEIKLDASSGGIEGSPGILELESRHPSLENLIPVSPRSS